MDNETDGQAARFVQLMAIPVHRDGLDDGSPQLYALDEGGAVWDRIGGYLNGHWQLLNDERSGLLRCVGCGRYYPSKGADANAVVSFDGETQTTVCDRCIERPAMRLGWLRLGNEWCEAWADHMYEDERTRSSLVEKEEDGVWRASVRNAGGHVVASAVAATPRAAFDAAVLLSRQLWLEWARTATASMHPCLRREEHEKYLAEQSS